MNFKNACFFSYRHRPGKEYANWIDDIHGHLSDQVALYLSTQGVFRDTSRLAGGDLLDPSIAQELCESVCMVMVYVPAYFDDQFTYCAREFKAMQALESQRLKKLSASTRSHGLIIPIVCRGWSAFPGEISRERVAYNFEPYLLEKDKISKHPKGKLELKRIAEYIYNRVNDLQPIADEACQECPNFNLPSENEIANWVREVKSPKPLLPGRSS